MAILLQSLLEIFVYREESLPRGFTCLPWLAPKADESGEADAVLSEIAIVHSFFLVGWIAGQEIRCGVHAPQPVSRFSAASKTSLVCGTFACLRM
jgi:hypothetical protein